MTKALVLTAITGSHAGKRITLTARVNALGSAPTNDVVLHDRQIAPRHVEIRQVLERWFVVPLSSNGQGLALNGLDVKGQSRLNLGDALTLGPTTYTIGFEEIAEREVGTTEPKSGGVPRLGEYFTRHGIMSSEQVTRAAERQAALLRSGTRLPFGQVAYEMGFINRAQLDSALAEQRSDFNERFWD
jgi:pSer/pThr/pTyr-binding forkhead associated (FHA) protein